MYKFPFLDFEQLNHMMIELDIAPSDKLKFIYEAMYGVFHDREKELMSGAVVGIVAVGGLPVTIRNGQTYIMNQCVTVESMKDELLKTVGMSAFMSYLNPRHKILEDIAQTTLNAQHYSVLHTINLNILVAGISSGVEHELSSQRDIIHLSRLTVAKTKSQDNPCLVLRDPAYKEAYKKVLGFTRSISGDIPDSETRNLLFPNAKASAVMLSGTLKNFMKLVALKDAGGKEEELVALLEKLDKVLPRF